MFIEKINIPWFIGTKKFRMTRKSVVVLVCVASFLSFAISYVLFRNIDGQVYIGHSEEAVEEYAWVLSVHDLNEEYYKLSYTINSFRENSIVRNIVVLTSHWDGDVADIFGSAMYGDDITVKVIDDPVDMSSVIRERFKGTFFKLHAWLLTDFTRVTYIDYDVIAQVPRIDDWFRIPLNVGEIAVAPAHSGVTAHLLYLRNLMLPRFLWYGISCSQSINAGVISLRPSTYTYEEILRLHKRVVYELSEIPFHDQPLIEEFFQLSMKWMNVRYNVRAGRVCKAGASGDIRYPVAVHYIGAEKPWDGDFFKKNPRCAKYV